MERSEERRDLDDEIRVGESAKKNTEALREGQEPYIFLELSLATPIVPLMRSDSVCAVGETKDTYDRIDPRVIEGYILFDFVIQSVFY